MPRTYRLPIVVTIAFILCPSLSHAQAKDAFVEGLTQLINVADGTYGDEGPALVSAIDAMTRGLAEWDARIASVESRLGTEITSAPPPVASRMRAALGTAYLERGRIDAALSQFSASIELDPSFAQVYVLRGLACERANRADEAAAAYRAALQRDPENAMTAYLVLKSARGSRQKEGLDAARSALSKAAERVESVAEESGFLTTDLLNDASVSAPLFPRVAYARGFDLIRQDKYDEALASLREAVNADPLVTDRALQSDDAQRGAVALRQQNIPAAVASLEAAASRNPESSEVHRVLGMALGEGKQYDSSLAHLRTAARLNPRDERTRLATADVLVASGNPAAAHEVLRDTVRDLPGSAEAYWKLGTLDQSRGEGAEALRSFERMVTLPIIVGVSRVYAILGRAHHGQFNLVAATEAYAHRAQITPNDRDAHFDLGEVYRAQDTLDEALAEYLVAARLDPTNATTFAMIGQVHAAAGRDEQAVLMLRRAVTLDPMQRDARYGLSRALLRLGKTEEAQQELRVFEQAQARAMEEERRRFLENQQKIDDVLKVR